MSIFRKLFLRHIVFFHDLLMVPIAWFGAYWLRFNLATVPPMEYNAALAYLPIVVIIQTIVFRLLGLYRGVWRFASVPDLLRISKAIFLGVITIFVVLFLYQRLAGVPRSVFPLYIGLLLLLLATPRFLFRYWKDNRRVQSFGKRAIIVGAGMAGEMLVRDLFRERNSRFYPIAFVDDDQLKRRREIHGVRVKGSCRKLPKYVQELNAEIVLIAIPSATDKEMQRIVTFCDQSGVPFLTLPSVKEMLTGRVSQHELRDVSIEDLLGRDPVQMNWEIIHGNLKSLKIMITGGGGSIGSELCKQLSNLGIGELIIFEKGEFNLYRIQSYLIQHAPDLTLTGILGDVTDENAVNHAFEKYQPNIVFHAAAYKHVPLLQNQVCEAVKNNVLGTEIVGKAALRHGVEKFVLISTDKAVNPTSVMGTTKRAAELICQSLQKSTGTKFLTVRFGNVLDSAGSVVPLFKNQIQAGGPVTVTHPDVTRYFMTIPEACQLIMQAAAVGVGGEVFVLDMGEPVKINYLAEQMIRLSGKKPGEDIDIIHIGLKKGEKLHEELFYREENAKPTKYPKLLLARSNMKDTQKSLCKKLEELKQSCVKFDEAKTLSFLIRMVPESIGKRDHSEDVIYIASSGKSLIQKVH